MKKFYRIALSSLLIVSLWWLSLSAFATYRVRHFGVTPSFPYYESLLVETDPAHAVWAHFDGAHYLKLAKVGYVDTGTQAFFPVYPLLIRTLHLSGLSYFSSARLISFVSLVLSLVCLHYLFGKRARELSLILLLFPTSFYLAGVYTESLFLLLTLLFFLLLKRRAFFLSALVAGLASGTRLVGVFLALSLLIEIIKNKNKSIPYTLGLVVISLSGFLGYLYFLNHQFGDPLMFVHVQSMFGAGRSNSLVFLPQVLYRYARILLTVNPQTLVFVRAVFELLTFISAIYLAWSARTKLTLPYAVYLWSALLLPTLSGSLSSLPRYALILIPFLVFSSAPKTYFVLSAAFMFAALSLFAAGLFVA